MLSLRSRPQTEQSARPRPVRNRTRLRGRLWSARPWRKSALLPPSLAGGWSARGRGVAHRPASGPDPATVETELGLEPQFPSHLPTPATDRRADLRRKVPLAVSRRRTPLPLPSDWRCPPPGMAQCHGQATRVEKEEGHAVGGPEHKDCARHSGSQSTGGTRSPAYALGNNLSDVHSVYLLSSGEPLPRDVQRWTYVTVIGLYRTQLTSERANECSTKEEGTQPLMGLANHQATSAAG